MTNRYVVSKETLKKIAELPKPEINKDLQEKVKTQIENAKMKTYLVTCKTHMFINDRYHNYQISSYIEVAESQNDAVKAVAKRILAIGNPQFMKYHENDEVEILSVTEIESGFRGWLTQEDFKDEN